MRSAFWAGERNPRPEVGYVTEEMYLRDGQWVAMEADSA